MRHPVAISGGDHPSGRERHGFFGVGVFTIANGYYSDPFSKWFGCYLRGPAVVAYSKKTTFHSLRHNCRDALRDTEMSGEMVRALGGWSNGGNISDDYGSGFTPERLYGAIKAVRYDGLDLSHLYLP